MSIATEISRLQTAKASIKSAIEDKGVVVPASATLETYDEYISGITTGNEAALIQEGGLTNYTIPSGVTIIRGYAFKNFASLTALTVSNTVTAIRAYAFEGSGLKNLVLSSSATNTGNYICNNCTSLTGVTIPEGVTVIGTGAFSGCTSLQSATIPSTVGTIGAGAFSNCSGLKYIKFLGTTPPGTTNANFLGGTGYTFPIYVPDEAVDTYKAKQYYTGYAPRICGFSEMPPETIEGYTILDYIQSDGTFYIPTGIYLTSDMWYDYKFKVTTAPGSGVQKYLLSGDYFRVAQIGSTGNFYVRRGGDTNRLLISTDPKFTVGTELNVVAFKGGNDVFVNGVSRGSVAADSITNDRVDAWFFSVNNVTDIATYGIVGQLFYMKIGTGNTILYNFVPVMRNSDNKVGVYDAKNNTFYPSVSVS